MANTLYVEGLERERQRQLEPTVNGAGSSVRFTLEVSELANAILPLLKGEEGESKSLHFASRYEILDYVDRCETAGFCHNLLTRQACAKRWMAGKRKVSAPFAKTRKRAAAVKCKALKSAPAELLVFIQSALGTSQGLQFKAGNAKALNALVGMVLKQFKYDAAAVKELIQQQKEA